MINQTLHKQWAAALLTFTLLWLSAGCTVRKVSKVDVNQVGQGKQERIVGVSTKRGEDVSFDSPGGTVKDNTITANVKMAPYSVSVQDVQRVWVERREPSTARTIGLVAAIAVGTLALTVGTSIVAKQSCPFGYSWDGTCYVVDAVPDR